MGYIDGDGPSIDELEDEAARQKILENILKRKGHDLKSHGLQ